MVVTPDEGVTALIAKGFQGAMDVKQPVSVQWVGVDWM